MSDNEGPSHTYAAGNMVLGQLGLLLTLFAAIMLFELMVLHCLDVIDRYGFNAPLPETSKLTALGLCLLIFGTLPVVTAHSEHVSVGLIEVIVGHRSRRLERVVLLATSLVALALMLWRL